MDPKKINFLNSDLVKFLFVAVIGFIIFIFITNMLNRYGIAIVATIAAILYLQRDNRILTKVSDFVKETFSKKDQTNNENNQ